MSAAADIITKNEKLTQDAKTQRLRKLREERDALAKPVKRQSGKKVMGNRPTPETTPPKRTGTEILVSRVCARISEETGLNPSADKRAGMWSQVIGLRSEFPELTDEELIKVVIADYEP
jgi:hypothetical protein